MAVSKLSAAGGANDFNINVGGAYTSIDFTKEYSSGSYSIVSLNNDSTYDVYIYNASGTNVGYTKSGSLTASTGFSKMVILGGTTADVLSFSYKTTYVSVDDSDEVTAGPVATSVSPSAVPKVDDTFTLTGRNFASNCTVTFSSTTGVYTSTAAKSIVRSSATSLIVTRPDNIIVANSPYTITVENPGVTNPTGSNSHILPNSITAGAAPVWVTGAVLNYTTGSATSLTLLATDADAGSDVDYSVVSGTLPTGLSFDGETGVISGTPTTSNVTVTFRATDQGGNFVDKAILFNANPVWVTAAGTLSPKFAVGVAYTTTVSATDDNTAVSYSLQSGSFPTGLSLNTSTGVISGTTTSTTTASITLRASDTNGGTADRTFSVSPAVEVIQSFTTVGTTTFTLPASASPTVNYLVVAGGGSGGDGNGGGGGGGAGGMIEGSYTSLTPGSGYTVTVGAGGAGHSVSTNLSGNLGGNSVFHTATANGGGAGRGYSNNVTANGGSGGGGTGSSNGGGTATIGTVPAGATGYGNNGGNFYGGNDVGGGGGGAGGSGGTQTSGGSGASLGGASRSNSITGSAYSYCGGGAGGGSTSQNYGAPSQYGWGSGGTYDGTVQAGMSGIVVLKYYV